MKKILTAAFCTMLAFGSAISVYAAEVLDRDTVESAIWEDMWTGKGDNGLEYPEASYKHHLLDKWLDENYGSDEYDWSALGEVKREYKKYYRQLIDNWDFEDDNSGGWTIETEDNHYSFTLLGGNWQMIDRNGSTVDSFPPFNTLTDKPDVTFSGTVIEPVAESKESPRVTGNMAAGTVNTAISSVMTESTFTFIAETVITTDEERSESSFNRNLMPIIIGIAAGSIIGSMIYFLMKRK